MGAPWRALSLDVPDSTSEEISGRLALLSCGTEFRRGPAYRFRLLVYLRGTTNDTRALAAARQVLEQCGLDAGRADLQVIEIEDGQWVERHQAALRPFPLGRGFLVDPTGSAVPARERIPIRLVPGRAFGTGEHATTQLCAEQLERHVVPGSHWLDLGCGTGLLSVVASSCGAGQVLALDIDPEAVRVARAVLKDNRPSARVDEVVAALRRGGATPPDGMHRRPESGELFLRGP